MSGAAGDVASKLHHKSAPAAISSDWASAESLKFACAVGNVFVVSLINAKFFGQ